MSYEKLGREYMITSSQTTLSTQSQSQSQSVSQSQYQNEDTVHLNDAQNRQPNQQHLNEFDLHPDIEQPARKYYIHINGNI